MSLLQRVCKTLGVLGLVVALPSLVSAQSGYVTNGGEYAPAGNLPGDQTYPSVAFSTSGGYLVWQDNITDGSGLGISAVQLNSTLSPAFSNFRVNVQGSNDQENAQVALLNGGGAAFVWQGGQLGFQHIYARFLSASNLWITGDVMVNVSTTNYQVNPAIATLPNGNLIITWASVGQDNPDGFQGVYARIFSPTGTALTGEFLINQTTPYNQRTPALAVFTNGNFVIAWVSEKQRSSQPITANGSVSTNLLSTDSIDIYARIYNSDGTNLTSEFLVNTSTNPCANPAVATASDGTFIIAWSQKDLSNGNNGWDIWCRSFNAAAVGGPSALRVNTQLYGDQYRPKISSIGTEYLVVWTSMAQDGSREGVYAQFLNENASPSGGEFRVNTTILNSQIYPTVASDGAGQFLTVWSSYVGGVDGMDLYAQRYATYLQPLSPPGTPIVTAVNSYTLSVTWAPIEGFNVAYWNLFVDSSATAIEVTNIYWVNPSFYSPGQTHTFQLAYVLSNGQTSPLSTVASGTTWGVDTTFSGLPDDWETLYYGSNKARWPKNANQLISYPGYPSATVLQVFEWGANPQNPSTWLTTSITNTPEGWFLSWNTQPGYIYQVQTTTNLTTWTNLGSPRFAAGTSDSIYLGLTYQGFFQITRLVY